LEPISVKDPAGDKKADKDAVVQAITSLKARGADVNPYSVAAEADVCRASLVNNPELMSLVNRARHNAFGNGRPAEALQPPAGLDVVKLQQENDRLRYELTEIKIQADQLTQEVTRLTDATQQISKTVNIAYQQGYIAGQQAEAADHDASAKSLVQNLAEAAKSATTDGASASQAEQAPERTVDGNNQDLITAYVGDVPLHIEDPEVLNDPFTAKLLSALQEDLHEVEGVNTSGDLIDESMLRAKRRAAAPNGSYDAETITPPPVQAQALPIVTTSDQTETVPNMDVLAQAEGYSDFEEGTEFEGPDGRTRFTAQELHELFQNKYVKNEDGTESPAKPTVKANETSQKMKKFVGTNKQSLNEPLPTLQRAFPPDIRRACRLLGLNPEDISRATVIDAWKHEMAKPGVHPDTGGDTEMAIYLNTAKDTLMRWAEDQAPKLGKKFGQKGSEPRSQPKQE
jgi:hypothetical protein